MANTGLYISQWQSAPKLRAVVDVFIEVVDEYVRSPKVELQRMLNLDTAQGVWLDYLGERLGLPRPTDVSTDEVFGFDEAGSAFDRARMSDLRALEPLAPIGDDLYRRLIRAKVFALNGFANFDDMQSSAQAVDKDAIVIDNFDMTGKVTTSLLHDMMIAHNVGALAKPAGVEIEIVPSGRFGFDEAGSAFDQGGYANE